MKTKWLESGRDGVGVLRHKFELAWRVECFIILRKTVVGKVTHGVNLVHRSAGKDIVATT